MVKATGKPIGKAADKSTDTPMASIGGEPITDVRRDLKQFVETLIEVGKASLQSKIPDRKDLQRAVDKLDNSADAADVVGAVTRAIGQSEPGEAQEHALLCLWGALASAYIIGSRGTLSDNSKKVAKQVQAQEMRATTSKRRQEDPTTQILSEAVDKHLRPGDEAHPYKAADAMLISVNQAIESQGVPPAKRNRIAKIIKDRPVRP
jgi:hypothetical protein